ncbi:hypothetical protein U9608_001225 [Vibrio alginolyticus]|nr:hypothetical protein [Vibrio alginolyticus]
MNNEILKNEVNSDDVRNMTKLMHLLTQHDIQTAVDKFLETDWFDKNDKEKAFRQQRRIYYVLNEYHMSVETKDEQEFDELYEQRDIAIKKLTKQVFDYHTKPSLKYNSKLYLLLHKHGIDKGIKRFTKDVDFNGLDMKEISEMLESARYAFEIYAWDESETCLERFRIQRLCDETWRNHFIINAKEHA